MLKINFFSDQRFIERIQQNDRRVLGELYLRYEKMVNSYVGAQGGSVDDAEDLLQEAIIVLWQKARAGSFELRSKLSTYLMAVVKNKWQAERRKMYHQSREEMPDNYKDDNPGGLDILLENEKLNMVRRALDEISEICKKLLMMFYFEEQSMEEIAAVMQFANPNVAKAKKYQCKKALEKLVLTEISLNGGNK